MTTDGSEPARPAGEPAREQLREQLRERLRPSRFGPSALATPANAITVARLLATPLLVVLVAVGLTGWAPFGVAFAIGVTDGFDGWIARRQGTTRSGAFLDPLADKVVVLSALFVLAARAEMAWWPVGLIAGREVAITVYRSVVGRKGISIPARRSAKVKTLVQGVAILLALAPPVAPHKTAIGAVLWVAVAFTLVTGAQYFLDGRKAVRSVVAVDAAPRSITASGGSAPGVVRQATTLHDADETRAATRNDSR
ncbi:MAG TPA: CDP-alcohol phosphatidyltransferase family protein [Acidimicrobiales bacterium]|nr:CDP-alcohol phosphatidyltransferase family protein [Acidimicrobiales bacterium]